MDDIQWQIFTYIVSQVETPLTNAILQVVNAFLSYIATPLKLALVLYIALTGILILRGEINEAGSAILGRFLKMGLIVWILTDSGIYQQYVYDFFFTTLPQGLANALTTSDTGGTITANSFDLVWIKAWRAGLEVWRTLSWQDIGLEIIVCLFWLAAIISIVFCFSIWLISRLLLGLYIALGPLLIPLVLFPATRAIFERWIGSLISCVTLQITTVVLLYIVLDTEQQVIGTVSAMGSTDSMAMTQVLLAGVIFFGVAAFVAFQLPGVASSLAGGLHFHTGAIARSAQTTLRLGKAAVGSTGRTETDAHGNRSRVGRSGLLGLGHATASSGRAIYQRIRPSTGGSLSDRG